MNHLYKKFFYSGIIGISLFEILNVFFIMPMPGSQEIKSINIAYFHIPTDGISEYFSD